MSEAGEEFKCIINEPEDTSIPSINSPATLGDIVAKTVEFTVTKLFVTVAEVEADGIITLPLVVLDVTDPPEPVELL